MSVKDRTTLEDVGLFDMDGSLADYTGQLEKDLLKLAGPGEPPLGDLWKAEKKRHIGARMRLIKALPGWWRNLPPIEAGMKVFELARELGFTNNVLTKGPKHHPMAWQEKVEWCRAKLGQKTPVHITEDKGLVYGKFLYDDFPEYCIAWLRHRPRGLVIMPVNSWNVDFHHPQVIKYDGTNLDEVREALEICLRRQKGEPLVLPQRKAKTEAPAAVPASDAAPAAASADAAASAPAAKS